jgi:putative transposase
VFDACANGQTLKCLTLIDEFTRECLAIDVAGSIRSPRVMEVLNQLISTRGAPRYLRSDNGPEFVSKAILEWLESEKIETALICVASPTSGQNVGAEMRDFDLLQVVCRGSEVNEQTRASTIYGGT